MLALLVLVFSCAKNNPVSASDSNNSGNDTGNNNNNNNNDNQITIASYEGTYTGKAKYTVTSSTGTDTIEENVSLIVNKDSTLTFKTQKKMIKIIILQKLKIMQI